MHSSHIEHGKRAILLLLAAPVLYVLSYAPYLRLAFGADRELIPSAPTPEFVSPAGWVRSNRLPKLQLAYRPVEWLVDKTPLIGPMKLWCRLWKVEDTMIDECRGRLLQSLYET